MRQLYSHPWKGHRVRTPRYDEPAPAIADIIPTRDLTQKNLDDFALFKRVAQDIGVEKAVYWNVRGGVEIGAERYGRIARFRLDDRQMVLTRDDLREMFRSLLEQSLATAATFSLPEPTGSLNVWKVECVEDATPVPTNLGPATMFPEPDPAVDQPTIVSKD